MFHIYTHRKSLIKFCFCFFTRSHGPKHRTGAIFVDGLPWPQRLYLIQPHLLRTYPKAWHGFSHLQLVNNYVSGIIAVEIQCPHSRFLTMASFYYSQQPDTPSWRRKSKAQPHSPPRGTLWGEAQEELQRSAISRSKVLQGQYTRGREWHYDPVFSYNTSN